MSANVTIHIQRTTGGNVRDATVHGIWSTGNTDSCKTGANGQCSIARGFLFVYQATFTVTNVTHASLPYQDPSPPPSITLP